MKQIIAISVFLLSALVVQSQSVASDRSVLGSSGGHHQGTFAVSYSIGETVIATGAAETKVATQGFEQPSKIDVLNAVVVTTPESCRGANDGTATIVEFSGCSEPYNAIWSNGHTGLSAAGLPFGSHQVTLTADNCTRQVVFIVELAEDVLCNLIFYSGITPNADGDNDYWHIGNIDLPQFADNVVQIFNRWGDEVWTARGYNNQEVRWEGQGKQSGNLPDGTYFYVVEVNNITHKGYIELTR